MKKLLSLPPNLVRQGNTGPTIFHDITGLSPEEYFCTCDPEGQRVGSGGGTAWLLSEARRAGFIANGEKAILIHAGGQSRRLPAYAPSGKVLTPIPVMRWERGQRLGQDLLSLQLPLLEQIMALSPQRLTTMVVSGDVLIRATEPLAPIPDADVVCYGLWLDATIAKDHGVFVSSRTSPQQLSHMLQKPTIEELQALQHNHYYLTDIGIWLLSDRAVRLLEERVYKPNESSVNYYDLYSDFGRALGTHPEIDDEELRSLSVAIVPLAGGEFYHFGTSAEMISSTLTMQNLVSDQRQIMHHDRKPQPSIFVQNSELHISFTTDNRNIWVENSCIGPRWKFTHDNVVTGVPHNDWQITLQPGECLDIVPIGADNSDIPTLLGANASERLNNCVPTLGGVGSYAVRRYNITDRFDGEEQQRPQFPVLSLEEIGPWLESITSHLSPPTSLLSPLTSHLSPPTPHLLSAEQLSAQANLGRLFRQREEYRLKNIPAMARNWEHSVFYQLDLDDIATQVQRHDISLPPALPDDAPLLARLGDYMLRNDRNAAFGLLRQALTDGATDHRQLPRLGVCLDQIVWSRSPVRIDIAGGWTDTPPYCLMEGGAVVNLAIELNGQPPIQAYVKPSREHRITLRSIDLGAHEVITTYDELRQFNRVGSPFSIPKAALALAGFLPEFSQEPFTSLEQQLAAFGAGIELTLFSAIPAGSGLGTSSVLAATVLGALSEFCSLAWDKGEIGRRTLILEQLLTTGGGWQDQFGGILSGVKLLETQSGLRQEPLVRWLPNDIYTQPDYQPCHLLYYTGITRTAKHILAEIVRRMFLCQHEQLLLLRQMKQHALDTYEAILRRDFILMGRLLRENWQQNQRLDSGTNPEAVKAITNLIDDLCLGYKLPGAGGGGYLYMVAKDPEAASRIRHILNSSRPNPNARFVDMQLSCTGLQTSRS